MARIKNIRFDRAGRNEGCCCDRCGQYLQNIWTVEFSDGVVLHFGIDCFEKMTNEKLTKYGQTMMRNALKSIQQHKDMLVEYMTKDEDTDIRWQNIQNDPQDYWYGRDYLEFKNWMLTEFFPCRIREDEKKLKLFSKVEFNR